MVVSPDTAEIERLVTSERLTSYVGATGGDLHAAIELYDWNHEVSAALFGDLGRLEVVVRNVIHRSLSDYVSRRGAKNSLVHRFIVFPGSARRDIDAEHC